MQPVEAHLCSCGLHRRNFSRARLNTHATVTNFSRIDFAKMQHLACAKLFGGSHRLSPLHWDLLCFAIHCLFLIYRYARVVEYHIPFYWKSDLSAGLCLIKSASQRCIKLVERELFGAQLDLRHGDADEAPKAKFLCMGGKNR